MKVSKQLILARQVWNGESVPAIAEALGVSYLKAAEAVGTLRHRYYVYCSGASVFARFENQEPKLVETCSDPQAAYDKVQSIVNPSGAEHTAFAEVDENGNALGFLSEEFQSQISSNCESVVKAAYGMT